MNPNNSESCTSIILNIVRQNPLRNYPSYSFYKYALMRYEDFESFQESKKMLLSNPKQNSEKIKLFNRGINVLSRIENYIALEIANNDNTYTDDFVEELASWAILSVDHTGRVNSLAERGNFFDRNGICIHPFAA